MLPDEGLATDHRDASLTDFSHVVGCDCAHCRVIRRLGPKGVSNPLVRLMQQAQGVVIQEADERIPKKERRKRARLAHKRGVKGLVIAIRNAA